MWKWNIWSNLLCFQIQRASLTGLVCLGPQESYFLCLYECEIYCICRLVRSWVSPNIGADFCHRVANPVTRVKFFVVTPLCAAGRIGLPKCLAIFWFGFALKSFFELFFLLYRCQETCLIFHTGHFDKSLVLAAAESFCQLICNHSICWNPADFDWAALYFLPKPVWMYVNVAEFGLQFCWFVN